jgi:hypothetical protein
MLKFQLASPAALPDWQRISPRQGKSIAEAQAFRPSRGKFQAKIRQGKSIYYF